MRDNEPMTMTGGPDAAGPAIAEADATVAASSVTWVRSVAAAASLGAAAVHAAAIPVHFDHGTRYGVAFIVMAVTGTIAALLCLLSRWRLGLWLTAMVNAAIVALWFLATTHGVPGDTKEAIGLASAVATMLEVSAITAAVVGLSLVSRAECTALPIGFRRSGWRAPVAAIVAATVLATPGVATAADHHHGAAADVAVGTAHAHDTTSTAATGASGAHDHPFQESGVSDAIAGGSITGIFSRLPAVVHPGGTGNAVHDASSGGTCAPSDEQVAAADKLVAATTLALLKYRDVNVAVADGYRPLGFEPNGVNHYINTKYLDDDVMVDPNRPEAILYGRSADGAMYPVGAMYMAGAAVERGPRIGGCLTPWHRHGFPFARRGETSTEMMHVWTVPLPGGPYAEHVEGEYARIYLGVDPINVDGDPSAAAGDAATTGLERLTQLFGVGAGRFGIAAVLNAVNVYRDQLCAPGTRVLIDAKVHDQKLVDRMCDPVLNGALPGASAPDISTLLQAFGRSGTK